jgi:hypothetical protein
VRTPLLVAALAGAALALAPVTAAQAGPDSAAGYVWASQPSTPSYTAATGYAYNSTGGPVQITRSGTGAYTVVFRGAAAPGAVAHANAYGSGDSGTCALASITASGADEVLKVRCWSATGAAADQLFVADMTNRRTPGAELAYLIADQPLAAGAYTPVVSYDSTGVAATVQRNAPGVYLVVLGVAQSLDFYSDAVHVQVTALTSKPGVRCQHLGPQDELPIPLAVRCADVFDKPVDTPFTLTFVHKTSLLGATSGTAFADVEVQPVWGTGVPVVRTWYATSGGGPVVTHVRTGEYQVDLPGLDIGAGHVIVHSTGNPATSCTVGWWWASGADVQCWDVASRTAADSEFSLALTA